MPTITLDDLREELRAAVADGKITTRQEERAQQAIDLYRPEDSVPVWQLRENIRVKYGFYPKLELGDMPHGSYWVDARRGAMDAGIKYIHPSVNQPNMIAFIKDPDHGERDVQSIMKVGKFLKKYSLASQDVINEIANWVTQTRKTQMAAEAASQCTHGEPDNVLLVTRRPNLIKHIYLTCSTGSCMSYGDEKWSLVPKRVLPASSPTDADMWPSIHALESFVEKLEEYFHPVQMYAFTPELAVAYYKDNGRVVSRAVVNVQRGTYTRVYGNPHITEMLSEAGYKRGTLEGFRMPMLQTTFDTYVTPYIDGESPPYANINMARGVLDVPLESASATAGEWSMRNYSGGALNISGGSVCKSCQVVFVNRRNYDYLYSVGFEARDKLCSACIEPRVQEAHSKLTYAWTYDRNESCWLIDIMPKEEAKQFDNLILHGDMISPADDYISLTASRARTLMASFGVHVSFFDIKQIHWDSVSLLVDDEYLHETKTFPECMARALSHIRPGEMLMTTAPVSEISGHAGMVLKKKYGSNVIISSCWDQYEFDLVAIKLNGRRTTYTLAEHAVMAIYNEEKEERLFPRSHCVYSMHTKEWYYNGFARRACHLQRMTRTLVAEDFMEHPKTMLEAMRVVANVRLAPLVEQNDEIMTLWADNHAFEGEKKVVPTIRLV